MSPKWLNISVFFPLIVLLEAGTLDADPPLEPNPMIEEIVASVSVDSFASNVDHLAGFFTRNAVSDTISQDAGIGAARRWIFDRFARISELNNDVLVPEYFNFEEEICGIPGLHRNVLATLPGTVHPDRYFVVGAHFDSRGRESCDPLEFAPGANDDGSGTAAVIELARVMSGYDFENSIIFATFTGEEQGLHGSEAYAARAESLGIDIRGMLNLDTISNFEDSQGRVDSTSFRIYSMGPTGSVHRQFSRLGQWLGGIYVPELLGLVQNREDRFGRGGDHQSFRRHGFTAIRFIETNENGGEQHNDQDVPANMNPSYGINVVRTAAAVLANMALAPDRPSPPGIARNLDGAFFIHWTRTNVEPDFSGYLLAYRPLPETGPFPQERQFKRVIDVGDVDTFVFDKFHDAQRYAISLAAYDSSGAVSFFSDEATSPFQVEPVDSLRFIGRQTEP